jgi:hypothetical protein
MNAVPMVNHSMFHQTNGLRCVYCRREMVVIMGEPYCPSCQQSTPARPANPCPYPELHR